MLCLILYFLLDLVLAQFYIVEGGFSANSQYFFAQVILEIATAAVIQSTLQPLVNMSGEQPFNCTGQLADGKQLFSVLKHGYKSSFLHLLHHFLHVMSYE